MAIHNHWGRLQRQYLDLSDCSYNFFDSVEEINDMDVYYRPLRKIFACSCFP